VGTCPRHWKTVRLKTTVRLCQNGLWGDEPDGVNDIICVRVADFDRVKRRVVLDNPTFRSVPAFRRAGRVLRSGDLLIEKSGGGERQPVGCVVHFDHPSEAICSNFVARMPVEPSHDARFLSYVHESLYSLGLTGRSIKQTTGIQNLDSEAYLDERVEIPPLAEQRDIAAFLDRKTAAIDGLIARKEQQIELLGEKRQALITQAVTRGLNPRAPMKDSGIEWLGEIPAHWSLKRLMHLTPARRAIMYGIVLPGPDYAGGVPIVKSGDCTPEKLSPERLSRTDPEIEAGYVRSRLRPGDIVFAIRGSVGATAIVPTELDGANLTQDAARIAPADGVLNRWLLYALQAQPVWAQLETGILGATVKGINIRDLKRPVLPVPTRKEQRQVAEFLDRATDRLTREVQHAEKSIDLLREYRQALISAAVTGKIDIPAEEAA